jgi:hypothetical protein
MLAGVVFMTVSSMTVAIYLPRLFLSRLNNETWCCALRNARDLTVSTSFRDAIVAYGIKTPPLVRNRRGTRVATLRTRTYFVASENAYRNVQCRERSCKP